MVDEPGGDATGADANGTFAHDIFAIDNYSLPPKVQRKLQPWHKPRKQYVRNRQWANEIGELLEIRNDNEPLRYIGLPGADLLDVRYFYDEFCSEAAGRDLVFLGFDTAAGTAGSSGDALNVSLADVSARARVDARSIVVSDKFQDLANRSSLGWDHADKLGPFDVINIDLCDHIGKADAGVSDSIYSAVHQLTALQSRKNRPWSVFLTSRIDSSDFSSGVTEKVEALLEANISTCPGFADEFNEMLESSQRGTELSGLSDNDFVNAAVVGLIKWFLKIGVGARCAMDVRSVAGYRVVADASAVDMVSIVLRFTPDVSPPVDTTGLSGAAASTLAECELARDIPSSVYCKVDVDDLLLADQDLKQECVEQAALLMAQAGYDPDEYRTRWG